MPPMVQKKYWLTSCSRANRSSAELMPLKSEETAMPAITMKSSDVAPRELEIR